jgi:hypothetical protein
LDDELSDAVATRNRERTIAEIGEQDFDLAAKVTIYEG